MVEVLRFVNVDSWLLSVVIDVPQESKREKVLQEQEKKRQALALPNEMREDDQVRVFLRALRTTTQFAIDADLS